MSAAVGPLQPPAGHADVQGRQTSSRLALSKQEAAEAIGVSIDTFERHVLPELRVRKVGPLPPAGSRDKRRVLIPVPELARWLDDGAAVHGEVGR